MFGAMAHTHRIDEILDEIEERHRERDRVQAKTELLLEQLTTRFGESAAAPEVIKAMMLSADREALSGVGQRLLDMTLNLDQVLAPLRAHAQRDSPEQVSPAAERPRRRPKR